MTKTVQYQNELHKFLIWDTAGQERVSSINIFHPVCIYHSDFVMFFNPTRAQTTKQGKEIIL